jgi:hypothetical protein
VVRVGGAFYPSPPPLSPGRGEGSWMRVQGEKQTLPPLPSEGRGDGGEGSKNPGSRLVNASGAVRIQCRCGLSVVRVGGAFYPSPPTPLPWKGRGELDADCGRKADAFTPLPFEGRGDGGEGSKNPGSASSTPPGQCGSSVVVEYPWCVWEGRFTPHPHPSPLEGERGARCGFRAKSRRFHPSPLRGERGIVLFSQP